MAAEGLTNEFQDNHKVVEVLPETTQEENIGNETKMHRLARLAIDFAAKNFGLGHTEPGDHMSEHFGHSQKRNDLQPEGLEYRL